MARSGLLKMGANMGKNCCGGNYCFWFNGEWRRIRTALSGRRPGYHRPRRVGLRSCNPRHGRERHNFHFIKATEVARSCVMDLMFRSEFTGRIMENTMVLCVGLNITDTSRSPGPIPTLKVPLGNG